MGMGMVNRYECWCPNEWNAIICVLDYWWLFCVKTSVIKFVFLK